MLKGIPQIMDITSIRSILYYLSNEIIPSKFEAAQQPEQNTIQISLRGVNSLNWIEICWQGDCARIIKIKRPEKIGASSTLAKQLSYGLKYMALVGIKQDKFDRVIKFEFAKKPGAEITKYLILELMGKHSNLFYLDRNKKIIAAGKQIKSHQSSYRTISTGTIYTNPPDNFKKEPDEKETYKKWRENLLPFPDSLKNTLIKTYQGVSPILTKQIEYIADLEKLDVMNQNINSLDDNTLKKIFDIWKIWINRFQGHIYNFSIFNEYFYCVWFSQEELKIEKKIDLTEGINNYYDHFLKLKRINQLVTKNEGIIFKQTKNERKNFNIQNKLLQNSENHENYKNMADNIFLNQNLKKEDIIEAERLYKKFKKLKRSQNIIKERLTIHKDKLNRLDEFKTMIENISSLNIDTNQLKINLLEEINEDICNEFKLKTKGTKSSHRKSEDSNSAPIEINSPGGFMIQIGRNMRQNELITFKLSRKHDLWFHAQESPGSHVLLKTSSRMPGDADIQIAADIAAFFCRAKGNIKVPINQVKIKDIQKIKKGGLGCVTFKNSSIIWGNPSRGKEYVKKNTQS
tara:strand:+ start:5360 stop:7078 length:1719 start_codon:yes stop_codon:yes gene_type:complete